MMFRAVSWNSALLLVGLIVGCTREPAPETPAAPVKSEVRGQPDAGATGNVEPSTALASSPELIELGKSVYAKQCSACHGAEGRGDGIAAYLLYPKPRDFVAARYRLVSTWEGVPTDADLFRTISRGMPGSAMPSWAHLGERMRWGLVHYLKSLAENPLEYGAPTADEPRQGVVALPPEPPYGEAAQKKASQLFAQGCAPCHGATGKGDGTEKQIDVEGFPTQPRDLTLGVFKGLPDAEHVYRRIVAGMPGTPMPSSSYLHGDDGWALVHLIRGMSSDEQRSRVEMRRFEIVAPRAAALPAHPDDSLWREATRVNLHLMPLWWRSQRPEELTVQALHDGKHLAVLLTWADDTHDHTAMRPQDFRDAAAIEFSLTPDPPFFAMGALGEFVNLWMWKSERQADLEPAFQDLDKIYPNVGIDAYPNLAVSPLEQPLRSALTLESDPTFVTGWGAGNIVSDPTRKSPAEDLVAQGFGTLSARPKIDQHVEATGVYSTGAYRVLFRRPLAAPGERSASLRPGSTVAVSFAIWNGSAGDRDGKKSVTIWQDLVVER
jgi:mono/diheme cytochrome c family protein